MTTTTGAEIAFDLQNEYAPLRQVVLGRIEGYHRDPARVEVVNEKMRQLAAAEGYPEVTQLRAEYGAFQAAMEAAGVQVHLPALAAETVQDQTCPRDIGFVVGRTFVAAGMRYQSRRAELDPLRPLLARCSGESLAVPDGIALEGGDVILADDLLFVGCGQRSDAEGAAFLQQHFGGRFEVVPLPCTSLAAGEDVLHLDCTFNPLGLGHALIYPPGLKDIPAVLRDRFDWIEVTRAEAAALATNVLSVAPDKVIARDHPACARLNAALRQAGYDVIEVPFDGVPATGGSFRCATLPLQRAG
ncbi:MAG TPA: arginine deiminase family protein [Kiloniellaceae bacterium]|nr:arginine deiminase family protein [Kiloniellaceae bacterium]